MPDTVLGTEVTAGNKKDKNSYSHGALISVISEDFFLSFFLFLNREPNNAGDSREDRGEISSAGNNSQG